MQYEDSNSFLTICNRISWLHFGTQNRRFRWLRARCLPFSRKRHRAQFAVKQQSFADISFKSLCSIISDQMVFPTCQFFFLAKVRCLRFNTVYHYILREEGTCYSTILPAARGVTSTASHKARFNADKVAQSNHFNREALENWKMIQHFQGGGKGVWEWLVVGQPICLSMFWEGKTAKPISGGCSRGSSAWSTLLPGQGDGRFPGEAWNEPVFFLYNHRRNVPPSAKPLSLNLPFFDWVSKHQRWRCVKSEIAIIWWGNFLLPSN